MVNINLLPWRQQKQEYERKVIKNIFLFTILLTVLIWAIAHIVLVKRLSRITLHTTQLNQAIATHKELKREETHEENLKAQVLYKTLLKERSRQQKLWSSLEEAATYRIHFKKISKQDENISFEGEVFSLPYLTDFLTHWSFANYFSHITIRKLQQMENHIVHFEFQGILYD